MGGRSYQQAWTLGLGAQQLPAKLLSGFFPLYPLRVVSDAFPVPCVRTHDTVLAFCICILAMVKRTVAFMILKMGLKDCFCSVGFPQIAAFCVWMERN